MKQSEMFNYSVYSRLGNNKKCCPGKQFVETGSTGSDVKCVKQSKKLNYFIYSWVIIHTDFLATNPNNSIHRLFRE